ncbi:MAG: MFS transporter [Solobacterium sp.]|jgi:MFS family permease|nr:MFS transporter [Solobacterium sp.]
MKPKEIRKTVAACRLAYIVQAIVNNLAPLLFTQFMKEWHITLAEITLITTLNFSIQLVADAASAPLIRMLGIRKTIVLGNLMAGAGLIAMTILPDLLSPLPGLLISVCLYAIGGGIIEVLVSPIMEACPSDSKKAAMALLHSFYCFGFAFVVAVSALFFHVIGTDHWRLLAILFSILPLFSTFCFFRVWLPDAFSKEAPASSALFHSGIFWVLFVLMFCSGASEQAAAQWASTFMESIGLSKAAGDLAGPLLFTLCMGASRTIYGLFGEKLSLKRAMILSALLCLISYGILSSGSGMITAFGCALCGFSVGIFWPGTLSAAAFVLPSGSASLYALLALAGDLGCAAGPTMAGLAAACQGNSIQRGISAAILFPAMILICLLFLSISRRNKQHSGFLQI